MMIEWKKGKGSSPILEVDDQWHQRVQQEDGHVQWVQSWLEEPSMPWCIPLRAPSPLATETIKLNTSYWTLNSWVNQGLDSLAKSNIPWLINQSKNIMKNERMIDKFTCLWGNTGTWHLIHDCASFATEFWLVHFLLQIWTEKNGYLFLIIFLFLTLDEFTSVSISWE